jgi:hypothetical protein
VAKISLDPANGKEMEYENISLWNLGSYEVCDTINILDHVHAFLSCGFTDTLYDDQILPMIIQIKWPDMEYVKNIFMGFDI